MTLEGDAFERAILACARAIRAFRGLFERSEPRRNALDYETAAHA